jgi:F0F1-type ATP synthase membrane subunit b/b'
MFKPLMSTIDERAKRLFNMNKEINDTEKRMGDILEQLKEKEIQVREEANAYKTKLNEEGNNTAAELYADFQKTVSELKKKTEDQVNSQIIEARKQLETESRILAKGIMEKMLDRRLES